MIFGQLIFSFQSFSTTDNVDTEDLGWLTACPKLSSWDEQNKANSGLIDESKKDSSWSTIDPDEKIVTQCND